MHLRFNDADHLYATVLAEILAHGDPVAPRGRITKEIRGATIVLDRPEYNVIGAPSRHLNYSFSVAEWLWMLLGKNDVRSIVYYNPHLAPYSDDGLTFGGAYGPKLVEQLPYVMKCLKADPESRQAVVNIWRERPGQSADIPCTVAMQFFLRRDLLEMHTYMRSNDGWLGLPYDLFNFTQIQRYLACQLDVGAGSYRHTVGSLHLYQDDWDAVDGVIDEFNAVGTVTAPSLPMTRMPAGFPAMFHFLSGATDMGIKIEWSLLPEPWLTYAQVLAYRTHKQVGGVKGEPYATLLQAREAARAAQ